VLFGISEMSRTRHPDQKRQSTRVKFGPSTNHDHKGLMNRLLIIAMAFALMTSAVASHAALGWTLDESIQNYGQPVTGPLPDEIGIGRTFYLFKTKGCSIGAFYLNGKISRVVYAQEKALEKSNFEAFLFANAPELVWVPTMDSDREWLACSGQLQALCWAHLDSYRKTLVIATIEDYNAACAAMGS
jgi:hypothetical protein